MRSVRRGNGKGAGFRAIVCALMGLTVAVAAPTRAQADCLIYHLNDDNELVEGPADYGQWQIATTGCWDPPWVPPANDPVYVGTGGYGAGYGPDYKRGHDKTVMKQSGKSPEQFVSSTEPVETAGDKVLDQSGLWTGDLIADAIKLGANIVPATKEALHQAAQQEQAKVPKGVAGVPTDGKQLPVDSETGDAAHTDPVNLANGAFTLFRRDMALPAPGVSFELTRAYHSRVELDGLYGAGWDIGYSQRILPNASGDTACDGEMVLAMGHGASMTFRKGSESTSEIKYVPAQPMHAELRGSKAASGAVVAWPQTFASADPLVADLANAIEKASPDTSSA